MVKSKVWRFQVLHNCIGQEVLQEAKRQLQTYQKTSTLAIDVAPTDTNGVHYVRLTVFGDHILIALLFQDRKLTLSISAPKKYELMEGIVRPQLERIIHSVLENCGDANAQILQIE